MATNPAADAATDATRATTDAAQAMFDRTRDAVDQGRAMFGKFDLSEMTEFGRGNMDAVVEASRIAAKGIEQTGQSAAAYVRSAMDAAQAQARRLAGVTSVPEFMRLQGDYARASFEAAVAETSRGTEAMLKLAGDVAQPLSNRMALAADRIKAAA